MQISAQPMPLSPEVIDDRVATVLEAGTNVTLDYDDVSNTLTINATPGGGGSTYTDEQAQDAVGNIIADSATIDFLYNDAAPSISGFVKDASITEPMLNLSDNTIQNSSATKHGLLPKLSNNANHFLCGDGTWIVPPVGTTYTDEQAQDAVAAMLLAGTNITLSYDDIANILTINSTASGSSDWARVNTATGTLTTGLLAFWRMEETSSNRVDSVAAISLVPNGGATFGAGKHGNAAKCNGVAGAYFAAADSPILSIGPAQDFTVVCWVQFDSFPSGDHGIVGKGNVTANYDDCEFMIWRRIGTLRFSVANGTLITEVNSGISPTVGLWYLIIGWLDAANNLLWIQVNNATPVSIACTHDSWDSTGSLEIGRQPGWSASPILDGRVDDVMLYKRILTADERTNIWNAGLGLDYPDLGSGIAYLHPTITTDKIIAGANILTASEPLESSGGIKLGNSSGTTNGILRYTGTDIEARIGGVWRSITTSTFLLLIDTPDTYSSNALKILRVNAATNSLEFGPVLGTIAEQNANNVDVSGGKISIGGHASTGVLDIQSSMETSDIANMYIAARIWPIAPSGAMHVRGLRVEAATGAALSTVLFEGLQVTEQPAMAGGARGLDLSLSSGPGRYNMYAAGTAQNYFAGNIGIANATPSYPLDVTGNVRVMGNLGIGTMPDVSYTLAVGGAIIQNGGNVRLEGNVGLNRVPNADVVLHIDWPKLTQFGIALRQQDSDTGGNAAVLFANVAQTAIGSITTTASATSYNTSSDARLKHKVENLTGSLDVIRSLRPISHLWNADDSYAENFLAHELQHVLPYAVTGEPDAINDDGSIQPQQVDNSKLVPRLVGAVKELLVQIEALTVRITELEIALGA